MTPHKNTRRAAALVATAAMVVVGVQTASAATAPDRAGDPTPAPTSVSARAAAIKSAQADATSAAAELGLGAKEKLVVRDVVKDADGTVHTRYERTYAGLPVLGGDLVTHAAENGSLKSVDKANDAQISVATTDAVRKAAVAPAR